MFTHARLTTDKPIKVDLQKAVDKIVIVFGEDKPSIIRKVEVLTGIAVPQSIKDEAEKNPL